MCTRRGSRDAMSSGGTCVPQSLVNRAKDAKLCIGIIPGMIGTWIPVGKIRIHYQASAVISQYDLLSELDPARL